MGTTTTKPLVLLGDDDPDVVAALQAQILQWGFGFAAALNKGELFERLRETRPALILLDLQFGNHDGLDVYTQLAQKYPSIPVVFLTAYGSIDTAVSAIKLGAYDYLTKPPDFVRLKLICTHAVERYVLTERVEHWEQLAESQASHQPLLGKNPLMQSLRDTIAQVATTTATVLIVGESGTGKELVAREIHARSGRSGLFVPVNMGSLPPGLVESALFGHDRGAFTGADKTQKGWCELADGGTLFLDEIGEMELSLQPKLLRFLQEQTVQRVGGGISQRVNVRILAATHRDPDEMVASGQLREDLYYRLNVFPIEVAPLRDRRDDIPLIATAILEQTVAKNGKPACWFARDVLRILRAE